MIGTTMTFAVLFSIHGRESFSKSMDRVEEITNHSYGISRVSAYFIQIIPPTIRKLHEIQTSDMEKGNRFFSSPHEKGLKSVVPMEK